MKLFLKSIWMRLKGYRRGIMTITSGPGIGQARGGWMRKSLFIPDFPWDIPPSTESGYKMTKWLFDFKLKLLDITFFPAIKYFSIVILALSFQEAEAGWCLFAVFIPDGYSSFASVYYRVGIVLFGFTIHIGRRKSKIDEIKSEGK